MSALVAVLRVSVLSRVLNIDLLVSEHTTQHHLLTQTTHLDTYVVVYLRPLVHLRFGEEVIGRTREAHDQRKVITLYARSRDRCEALWLVRHVVGAVVSGVIVLVHIDTEDREVSRVARPHPVVRVGAILTDSTGRSCYETHVCEDLLGKKVVAVAPVERL